MSQSGFEQVNPNEFDTAALTALPLMARGTWAVGQEIKPADCPPQHCLALLSGKVRVLDVRADGSVYTRATLEAGDLWDSHSWEIGDCTWVVAEAAQLGAIPLSAIQQYPFLVVCAERTVKKIQAAARLAESAPAVAEPPAPFQKTAPAENSPFARRILKDTLSCLRLPISDTDATHIPDLESLKTALAEYALKSQIMNLSWSQLRKLPTPWVLEDGEGCLHCVVSVQNHEIVTRVKGRKGKLSLDRRDNRQSWHVLVIQRPRKSVASAALFLPNRPFTLGWYCRLLAKSGFVSGQMLLASLMVQVFALGMPIFYMVIFDRVFGRQNLDTLDVMGLGMGLVLFADLVVRGVRSLVLTHLLVWVDRISIDTILDHIFQLPFTRMSRDIIQQCGELYHDIVKANEAVVSLLLLSSLDAVFSSIMILVLLNLHLQMALISLASLAPLSILAFISHPKIKQRAKQFGLAQRASQVSLSETLQNWETLHSHNAIDTAKDRVRQMSHRMLDSNLWARFDSISGSNLGNFIGSVGSVVTLYFGAHEVLQGQISYGAYAAINLMSRNVVGSVQKLFSSYLQFQEQMGRLEKYQGVTAEIAQRLSDVPPPDRARIAMPSAQGQIEIRAMRFSYPTDTDKHFVLGPLSLSIPAGQKIVLTGGAGSGKSTLIRLMQGLYPPTEGAITLDGYRLSEFEPKMRNRLIGVALQRPAFLSGTLLENLTLEDPDAPMKNVLDAMRLAQLDALIDKMPLGLDSMVAPMAANLQPTLASRLALARVFLHQPAVLMIDKAIDALEPAIQAAIFSPLLQVYAPSTCVFVTDFLPVHQKADRILVMRDGMIVEDGNFQSLIQAQGHYYHLHVVDKTFSRS